MKIISVVGTRPNFMKVAPIANAIVKSKIENGELKIDHLICHTGQHYDTKMSQVFFDELGLPKPNFYLGIGGGSHAEQTGKVMIEFEKILIKEMPDIVIVVGDVNSTIACSLASVKLGIKIAHVEAGLRSNDRTMPEEINRILTDSISDCLFVSEPDGLKNLQREGVSKDKVFYVGNTMIDSIVHFLPTIDKSTVLMKLKLTINEYILVTFHRPSNVDYEEKLLKIVGMLNHLSEHIKVVFPIHPRTKDRLVGLNLAKMFNEKEIIFTDPIGYFDFISLVKNSALVITDSGGIQEETTFLGVPCITTRKTTERPITTEIGTNVLVGEDFNKAFEIAIGVINGEKKQGKIPKLWDGKAAERIVDILLNRIAT